MTFLYLLLGLACFAAIYGLTAAAGSARFPE